MSAISLKSITGITSITTPAGVDNQLTLHNNNTTEAVKLDVAGNLHFHNHLNITGVSTASNFKTGTSNLHNTGLNVQDLDVDGHTNLDNVSIAGVSTHSEGIFLPDVKKITLGNSNDIEIYHDTLHYIKGNNSRSMLIQNDNANIHLQPKTGENALKALPDGAVELYHDNTKRLETSSAGVSITGNLDLPDNTSGNASIRLGNSQDFFMNHNGTHSYIINNTGNLYIRDLNGDVHIQGKDNEESIIAKADGAVELYYNNGKKLQTQSGGVRVFGDLENHDDDFVAKDAAKFTAGNSADLQMYHNGSSSFIRHTGTGDLYIDTSGGSADMYIRSQDNLHLRTNSGAQEAVVCVGNSGVILHNQGNARFNTDHDGAVVTEKRLAINRNAGDPFLQFQTSGTTHATLYGGSSTGFRVFTGGTQTERLRITSAGRVGINETSPDTYFHVKTGADTALAKLENTASSGRVQVQYLNPHGDWVQGIIGGVTDGDFITYTSAAKNIRFYTTGNERLRIDSSGRVSIGDNLTQTSNPFHIQGSSNTTAKIKCSGNDTANLFLDSNRNGASANIGLLRGLWNGTSVADIRFLTGIDTSNKDDGKIGFYTASAGTPSLRMIIDQEGTTHFSDNDVRTDIADVVNVKLYNPARFVARNGKHRERGFWSMSTGSGSYNNGYAHMKTNMATNSSTMFVFTMRGYSYGQGKIMFAETCGYCYSAHNNIINTENKSYDGTTTLSTYKSSDGYVCLEVAMNGWSSYYTGFIIDVQYANHAMGAMNYKVISSTWNNTNNHFA